MAAGVIDEEVEEAEEEQDQDQVQEQEVVEKVAEEANRRPGQVRRLSQRLETRRLLLGAGDEGVEDEAAGVSLILHSDIYVCRRVARWKRNGVRSRGKWTR